MKVANSIDRYRIYELVGKGGFADVYRAVELEIGVEVAIKKIDRHVMQQRRMDHRVRQEIEIHSTLKHPSVVEMYGYFMDSNYIYLVLEFCPNGDLRTYLDTRHSPFDEKHAKLFLEQIVEGLCYLHSHKIIHRDLTLSNIMLTKDFTVAKIADFGLAVKIVRSEDKHKTMCGTPNYIAPEVINRQDQGPDTDIWSVGIMLYTLLVGRPPFDTDSGEVETTLERVITTEVSWPKFLSTEVTHLMDLMLKKDPKERIKLSGILSHPFMNGSSLRESHNSNSFNDESGIGTSASWSRSTPNNGHSCASVTSYYDFPPTKSELSQVSTLRPFGNTYNHRNRSQSSTVACSHTSKSCVQCSHMETCSCCRGAGSRVAMQFSGCAYHKTDSSSRCVDGNRIKSSEQPMLYPGTVRTLQPNLPVPPLNTTRLQPMRHSKNKNVIYTIMDSGEVCMELLREKNQVDIVSEVLHISADGLQIAIHRPGIPLDKHNSSPVSSKGGCTYSYENLPEKHLHKYHHAALFVNLVKESTPKIIYYSQFGKCKLMENKPDPNFQIEFYNGIKIVKNKTQATIMSSDQVINELQLASDGRHLEQSLRLLWDHFKICLNECTEREKCLEELAERSAKNWFPITIGCRPTAAFWNKTANAPVNVPENKENEPPVPTNFIKRAPSEPSSMVSRASKVTSTSSRSSVIHKVKIPGKATAFHMSNGLISVQFLDNTKLDVQPMPSRKQPQFTFTDISGSTVDYRADLNMHYPQEILEKLKIFREAYSKFQLHKT